MAENKQTRIDSLRTQSSVENILASYGVRNEKVNGITFANNVRIRWRVRRIAALGEAGIIDKIKVASSRFRLLEFNIIACLAGVYLCWRKDDIMLPAQDAIHRGPCLREDGECTFFPRFEDCECDFKQR